MEPLNGSNPSTEPTAPPAPGELSPPPNYDNYEDESKPNFDFNTSSFTEPTPPTAPPADITSDNVDDGGGDGGLPPPPSYDDVYTEPTAYNYNPPNV